MTGKEFSRPISALVRGAVGLMAIVAALAFSSGVSGAQTPDPYNPQPTVSLVDDEVCGGESVVVTVSDVASGDSIGVSFAGQSSSLTAGPTGTASTSFSTGSIPAGTYTVEVSTGAGASGSATVTVLSAQDCDPDEPPTLSIADPSVCGGESAVATVTGPPGTSVTITFAGQSDSVTIGPDGVASTSFPTSGLAPGEYEFVADDGNGQTDSAPLFVLDPSGEECSPTPPPPGGPYLTVSASNTCIDQPIVATVSGANAGDGVTVTLAGHTADVTAGPDGSAQVSLHAEGLVAGTYDITATTTSGKGDSTQVRVLDGDDCGQVAGRSGSNPTPQAPSTPDSGGPLAFTGANALPLVVVGAALIAGGTFLVLRFRRSASA